ncbi:acidic mammalian chitinase-like [Rhodnius prolixus]|uniref:acidic mammalian chitinase-like n=1 Tax=Rhodnius prolixus TaxID=13249 RepID=UPI003D18A7AF
MKLVTYNLLFSVFVLFTTAQNEQEKSEKRIVCYYTNWSPYRPVAKFTPASIDPNVCTHLIYAFATFSNNFGLVPTDEYQDITNNGYKDFNSLKEKNVNLKTLISLGGTSEGSARFSKMVESEEKINYFIKSAIEFLRKYNFDGINLDWQFPTIGYGSKKEDMANYVKLTQALKEGFENEAKLTNKTSLLLTICLPSEIEYIEQGYDLNLQNYVDFFNILTYDYHRSNEGNVSHHAPLYPLQQEISANINTNLNADSTIQHLLKKGLKSDKLNLGIPTYGRNYKLDNVDKHDIGAPSKGNQGSKEFTSYYDICKTTKEQNWTVVHVNESSIMPYTFKGEDWIGFDDEESVQAKGEYARKHNLGGIMFWTLDYDDFNGECGNGKFPLINAGRTGLLGKKENKK